jgi:outer membrane murein-binding lipoprotein Lpp
MEKSKIDDIETQMIKLRAALPIWGVEANDLIELSRNAERAAAQVDERVLKRVRGLLETATGWHDTLLHWESLHAEPALSAKIRDLRGSLNAMRTEVDAAAATFKL